MIDLHGYLLEHETWDWATLLRHWKWLLPKQAAPWMVNRFGDVIMELPDGSIHHLDIGGGLIKPAAANRAAFRALCEDAEQANFYFMIPLVDELVAAGRTLAPGQCYSYWVAPAFEGTYTLDNVLIKSVADHYDTFGPMHMLTKDIPDGTLIEFTTKKPDQTME